MESTINERIKTIQDEFFKGNTSEFARTIGVKQPALRDIVGTKKPKPGYEILNCIVECSAININAEWLLTGRGQMKKNKSSPSGESDGSLYHYTGNFDGFINIFKKKIKPHYSNENFSYIFGGLTSYKRGETEIRLPVIHAMPIFSLCDIPFNRHKTHINDYGPYGIGLKKEWAKNKSINPVIYCQPKSILAISLRTLFFYFFNLQQKGTMSEDEYRAFNLFNYLLMYCKPYDNIPFKKEGEEHRRCYDEKEWRYIGLCDKRNGIPLSIPCSNKSIPDFRKFIKEKRDAQDKIMENDIVSDEMEITLQFTIDDITHIILPTEEKKEEFIRRVSEIEEYRSNMDEIIKKITVGYDLAFAGSDEMVMNEQNLENVKNSVAIGRDANGSEINVASQNIEEFIRITEKYQEHTDRMLAIIEKLINK
ncbi:MAG: hypothetical protein LBS42_05025 [Tannerella sp.]|jgi:hypothetical protein|nr:hypothetical protein [Tannerella sp.]